MPAPTSFVISLDEIPEYLSMLEVMIRIQETLQAAGMSVSIWPYQAENK